MNKFNSLFGYKKLDNYKKAVILAVVLHLALIIFLFVRFGLPKHYAADLIGANVIQAVAITSVPQNQNLAPNAAPGKPTRKAAAPNIQHQLKIKAQNMRLAELQALKIKKQKLLKKQTMLSLQKELAKEAKSLEIKKQRDMMRQVMESELAQEKHGIQEKNAIQNQVSSGEVDKYKAMLLQAIAANWIVPDGVDKAAACLLLVSLAPGGDVTSVKLLQPSGNSLLDRSAQTAVLKSSPLPVPSDPVLFDNFRKIRLTVRPEGFFGD